MKKPQQVSTQPAALKAGKLHPYQLGGLNWLLAMRACKQSGVLADDMGLGKTIQVIALLAQLDEWANQDLLELATMPLTPALGPPAPDPATPRSYLTELAATQAEVASHTKALLVGSLERTLMRPAPLPRLSTTPIPRSLPSALAGLPLSWVDASLTEYSLKATATNAVEETSTPDLSSMLPLAPVTGGAPVAAVASVAAAVAAKPVLAGPLASAVAAAEGRPAKQGMVDDDEEDEETHEDDDDEDDEGTESNDDEDEDSDDESDDEAVEGAYPVNTPPRPLFSAGTTMRGSKGPHLIIVPTSTLENWRREFATWAPSLRVVMFAGSLADRKQAKAALYNKRGDWDDPDVGPVHVVIASYPVVEKEADRAVLQAVQWDVSKRREGREGGGIATRHPHTRASTALPSAASPPLPSLSSLSSPAVPHR